MRPAQRQDARRVDWIERNGSLTRRFDRDESEQVMHASELRRIRKAIGLND